MGAVPEACQWIIQNFETEEEVSLSVVKESDTTWSTSGASSRDGMRGPGIDVGTVRRKYIACSRKGDPVEIQVGIPEDAGIEEKDSKTPLVSRDQDVLRAVFLESFIASLEGQLQSSGRYVRNPEKRAEMEGIIKNSLAPLLAKYQEISQRKEEECREFLAKLPEDCKEKSFLSKCVSIKHFDEFWKRVDHYGLKARLEGEKTRAEEIDSGEGESYSYKDVRASGRDKGYEAYVINARGGIVSPDREDYPSNTQRRKGKNGTKFWDFVPYSAVIVLASRGVVVRSGQAERTLEFVQLPDEPTDAQWDTLYEKFGEGRINSAIDAYEENEEGVEESEVDGGKYSAEDLLAKFGS